MRIFWKPFTLEEKLVVTLVFLFPALFFVVKGASNLILILLAIISVFCISRDRKYYFSSRDKHFWTVVLCLLAPLIGEIIAQVGRGQLYLPAFDNSLRFCGAASVFIYVSRRNFGSNLFAYFSYGAIASIFLSFVAVVIQRNTWWLFWNNRAATYFVDPITLGCYLVLLAGIASYALSNVRQNAKTLTLLVALTSAALFIVFETQSRTSWAAALVGLLAYVYLRIGGGRSILPVVFSAATVATCLYFFSDIFFLRIFEVYENLSDFISGGSGSSVGKRLDLYILDFNLILNYPFFGVQDGSLPPFQELIQIFPRLSEQLYFDKILAGSHSEYMAQLVSKGIFGGAFAIFGLLLYPLFFFYRSKKSCDKSLDSISICLLMAVIMGFGIQIFNLKMTASFWGIFLALSFAFNYKENSRA